SVEQESLSARTRKLLDNEGYKSELNTAVLKEPLGTGFPHYWFYKLEYILWEKLSSTSETWKNFKMTAKNSVEHISPQTQKDTDTNTVSAEMLNNFGNLSLVSRSINSEYSNLPFNEKRQRFMNNNRVKLDSLKMDLIYKNDCWSDTKAKEHQDEMVKIINEYLEI
ncbi:HNH endonuclease family protein, partial [Clostridium sp.]